MASRGINLPGILFVIFLLTVWEVCVDLKVITYQYLPAPHGIAVALWQVAESGELGSAVAHTVAITLSGWVIAAVIGVVLGVLMGIRTWAWRYSFSSLELLRAIPPITLVPAVLLLAGFTSKSEVIIVVYASVLPIIVSTFAGVRRAIRAHHDVARILGIGELRQVTKVILPGAAPSITVGLRVGLSLALALAVVSEMIGNPQGLGHAFTFYQEALRADDLFAFILVIGLLGVALNTLFFVVLRVAAPGIGRTLGEVKRT